MTLMMPEATVRSLISEWRRSHARPSARSRRTAALPRAGVGCFAGWKTLGRVSSSSTAIPSVPAFTANGRTAATPNSQPPAAGPASSLPTIWAAITRPLARSRSAGSTSLGTQVAAAVERSAEPTPVVKAVR